MSDTNKKLGRGFTPIPDDDDMPFVPIAPQAKTAEKAAVGVEEVAPSNGEQSSQHAVLQEVAMIGVSEITPNPQQPREHFDEDALDDLTASIRASGLLQPIVVRKFGRTYQIVVGERRWRASKKLGLAKIPALVREFDDEEMLELALLENVQREDLDPVEKARAYKRLASDFGLKQEEIAKKVGQKRSTIANYLRLLELPPVVLEYVSRGTISMGHARALLAIEGNVQRIRLCEKIIAKDLSVRAVELEAAVRRGEAPAGGAKSRKSRKTVSPHVKELEDSLTRALGTKAKILLNEKTGRGKIIIEFRSPDEFEKIQKMLGAPGNPPQADCGKK